MTGTETPKPKRLSLSEIVELLLARNSSEHSSVSLTRNSKGDTQIEVVVRSSEAGEVTTAQAAAAEARRLYDELRKAYPPATTANGA